MEKQKERDFLRKVEERKKELENQFLNHQETCENLELNLALEISKKEEVVKKI